KKKATETKKSMQAGSRLLHHFRHLGLPSVAQPGTWLSFNAAVQLIRQVKVLAMTEKVLMLALKPQDSHRKRARVFLTAYMFVMCPQEIFQKQEKEEKDLSESARQLLGMFDAWLCTHGRLGAGHARYEFSKSWAQYTTLFDRWKVKDREALLENTTAYYLQLFRLRQTILQHDPAAAEQLQKQLNHIRRQLEKLGGPRALDSIQDKGESSASEKKDAPAEKRQDTGRHGSVYQVLDVYADSPLDHLKLAHELVLHQDFDYKTYRTSSALERQIQKVAQRAYFDHVQQQILEHGISLSLIEELKQRLIRLAPAKRGRLGERIEQVMDLAWIQPQLRQKTFCLGDWLRSVLVLLSEMCAPIRDEEIEAVQALTSPVEQWEQIHGLCDRMELDLANVALRAVRVPLMKQAAAYEQARFAELLDGGQLGLARTRAWLGEVVARLCQVASTRHPDSSLPERPAVFEEAWVALIHPPMSPERWPESMTFDTERLRAFQKEAEAITSVAALLMLVRNLGRVKHGVLATLSVKLFTMLQDACTSKEHLTAEIERTLAESLPAERKALIKTMILKTLSHSDTVYSLLSRRVASVIKSTLQNKRFVTNAVMVSHGLEHVHAPLQALSQRVFRLAQYHSQIYASWYDPIIQEALFNKTQRIP
ncbi:T-complex protein 11-domain-containing protein, partial [Sporodiniella umbellata]